VFGLSFTEFMLILIVGIVVVGPRQLPALMRTAGQWIGKLRRMSSDLRSQSGIDQLIRDEGLEREIQEIRALSRVNVIDTLVTPVVAGTAPAAMAAAKAAQPRRETRQPLRDREYPLIGCDAYDARPDDASPYAVYGEEDGSGEPDLAGPDGSVP
jgi:sec-independent protein translocase protein TatB